MKESYNVNILKVKYYRKTGFAWSLHDIDFQMDGLYYPQGLG